MHYEKICVLFLLSVTWIELNASDNASRQGHVQGMGSGDSIDGFNIKKTHVPQPKRTQMHAVLGEVSAPGSGSNSLAASHSSVRGTGDGETSKEPMSPVRSSTDTGYPNENQESSGCEKCCAILLKILCCRC